MRNNEELNNLLSCVTIAQGGIHPLSLASIENEKNRSGSKNPATNKMELAVAIRHLEAVDFRPKELNLQCGKFT